ncbi:MAG: Crp/Fnr family transcriptional regulator [Burkholderiales bacterium]|nr:Crp/Fnr family transcriptional regulator [Burkholderiales bacterium]
MFAGIDEASRGRLALETTTRRLTAGESLWVTGQRADHVTLVQRGIIQIEQITAHGEGVVVGLFGAGDSIGLPAVLERGRYRGDAIALTADSDVLRIRAEPVLAALADSPALAMAVNHALVVHSAVLHAKIEIVTAGSVPRRLAALFLHLAARFGVDTGAGTVHLDLGLTREQIGRFVSTRVETVSRILSRWQKAGWLRSGRGTIDVLRIDMLRRILGI